MIFSERAYKTAKEIYERASKYPINRLKVSSIMY